MKLSFVLESIAVVSVGLGLARWHIQDPVYAEGYADSGGAEWLRQVGDGFFAGVAVAGFLGLMVEVAARRSPRPWGLGRWAWSVVGLFVVSRHALGVVFDAIVHWYMGMMKEFAADLLPRLRANLCHWLLAIAPYLIIAVWTTRWVSGPKAGRADGREWAGRIFGILIIVTMVVIDCLATAGF